MNSSQQHIDLVYAYLRAFKIPQPPQEILQAAAEQITVYDPTEDGQVYLEIPQAHGELLIMLFTYKTEIAEKMKGLLKEQLKRVKDGLDGVTEKTAKKTLGRLFTPPTPPDELKDRMRLVSSLDDLIWNGYRQVMIDAGVIETGQTNMGMRRTRDGGYIVVALPDDAAEKLHNTGGSVDEDGEPIGEKISDIIGTMLQELVNEENNEEKPENPIEPKAATKPDAKDQEVAGNMDEVMKRLGIGGADEAPSPNSPKP